MSNARLAALVLCLVTPFAAGAQTKDPLKEVRDCVLRNVPKHSSVQTVHFTSYDRIGGSREFRGKILGRTMDDGTRRAKLCISQPQEMRGSEVLSMEVKNEPPQNFLYTSELRKAKRISGEGTGGSLFGTDFTYEDLQRFMQLNRPESAQRLADGDLDGRPVYVIQATPSDPEQSSYSKVLSYVDKQTCVVLKSESYEAGDRLRKVLSAKPDSLFSENGINAPTEVEMKDVRDQTHTLVNIEDLDIDGEIDARSFQVSELGRHCR